MSIGILLRLVRSLPRQGRLVYCLFRDPRTPRAWKAGLGFAVFLIVTPWINIPEFIPVLGEMEVVGLLLLASKVAINRAPRYLVDEHEAAIAAGTSYFHQDVLRARGGVDELRGRKTG
jgi:uncharacterized membrane protein YkvA (DUF1232 family)